MPEVGIIEFSVNDSIPSLTRVRRRNFRGGHPDVKRVITFVAVYFNTHHPDNTPLLSLYKNNKVLSGFTCTRILIEIFC
jgi:hypothetical protein